MRNTPIQMLLRPPPGLSLSVKGAVPPTDQTIRDYLVESLPRFQSLLKGLSLPARRGSYLLLHAASGPHLLTRVFSSEPGKVNLEKLLQGILALHHHGVSGWAERLTSFTTDDGTGAGILAEYAVALGFARCAGVTRVIIGVEVPVLWSDAKDLGFESLLPKTGKEDAYQGKTVCSCDVFVQRRDKRRLVEVKYGFNSNESEEDPNKKTRVVIRQALRYVLAVKRHGLEGVEYVVIKHEDPLSQDMVRAISGIFERTETPYLIRGLGQNQVLCEGGLKVFRVRKKSYSPARPLPSLPVHLREDLADGNPLTPQEMAVLRFVWPHALPRNVRTVGDARLLFKKEVIRPHNHHFIWHLIGGLKGALLRIPKSDGTRPGLSGDYNHLRKDLSFPGSDLSKKSEELAGRLFQFVRRVAERSVPGAF